MMNVIIYRRQVVVLSTLVSSSFTLVSLFLSAKIQWCFISPSFFITSCQTRLSKIISYSLCKTKLLYNFVD